MEVTGEMQPWFAKPFRSLPQEHLEVLVGLVVVRRKAWNLRQATLA